MKKVRKILCLLAAAALTLTAACSPDAGDDKPGSGAEAPPASAAQEEGGWEPGFPLTQEPVELTIWATRASNIEDFNTNKLTKWYEEKTGVHINWISVEAADATTAFNLTLASAEYPDIYARRFSTSEIMMCAEDGVLLPLNGLIDQKGHYLKKLWEENPKFKDYMTAPDGNVYTYFYADTGTHLQAENKMFVYKPWLEQLGGRIPETTEEFKEMLIAFRDKDLNGNGVKDEIPYISWMGWGGSSPFGYMMDPFELSTSNGFFQREDGSVAYLCNTDGYRDGLAYMRELYREGLIAEETFVQDMNQLYSVVAATGADSVLVGCSSGIWQGMFDDNSGFNKQNDYIAIPPLKGPAGLRQTATDVSGIHTFFQNDCAITTACKNPDIALQWLDYWMSEEGTWIQYYGPEEGVDFAIVDEPNVIGGDQSYKFLYETNPMQNVTWLNTVVPRCDFHEVRFSMTYDPAHIDTLLYQVAQPYNPYMVYTGKPMVSWIEDTEMLEKQNNYSTLFGEYTKENNVAFVIGARDLDTEWDAYCRELEELGLPEYIEIMQAAYKS